MIRRVTTLLATAVLLAMPFAASADLTPYSQNFESMVQSAPNALSADGWLVFGNVFSPDHSTYYYGYGPFPAPNNTGAFCGVDFVVASPPQGAQDMVVYSDYNNGDHANGNLIEANVFQERTVGASNVGQMWTFQFDAMRGNLEAPTTAIAFIKTLNPAAGWAMTNFITFDTAALPQAWSTHSISITIDPSLAGQVLQFGFSNTGTNYRPSGMFYDNISFFPGGPTSTQSKTWGAVKSLYR